MIILPNVHSNIIIQEKKSRISHTYHYSSIRVNLNGQKGRYTMSSSRNNLFQEGNTFWIVLVERKSTNMHHYLTDLPEQHYAREKPIEIIYEIFDKRVLI